MAEDRDLAHRNSASGSKGHNAVFDTVGLVPDVGSLLHASCIPARVAHTVVIIITDRIQQGCYSKRQGTSRDDVK